MTPVYTPGEVRLTDPDFHDLMAAAALELDGGGSGNRVPRPVVIEFAAEGSAYDVTIVPLAACQPARPSATFPIGRGAPAPGAIYVVRDAWHKPVVHWLNGAFVLDEDVMSWDGWDAPWIDAAPFAALLSELQLARGRCSRTAWQRDYYRQVAEKAKGRSDDVGAKESDWPAAILDWYRQIGDDAGEAAP